MIPFHDDIMNWSLNHPFDPANPGGLQPTPRGPSAGKLAVFLKGLQQREPLDDAHRIPRPRGLTSPLPLPRCVSAPPRPPPRPRVAVPRVDGAGMREPLVPDVLYFGVGLEEAGGLSMKETSVVLLVVRTMFSQILEDGNRRIT